MHGLPANIYISRCSKKAYIIEGAGMSLSGKGKRSILGIAIPMLISGFPTSIRAQPCNPIWSTGFHLQGVNNIVQTMIVHDDGHGPAIYVGGMFTEAGNTVVNYIAQWDGVHWSSLGTGMDDQVWALAVYDDGTGPALYAGGHFHTAGGVTVNHIAKWNPGSPGSWSALDIGTDNNVGALTVYDDGSGSKLYAGGEFSLAGGISASRIARWDGTHWSAVGNGVTASLPPLLIRTMAVYDDGTGAALYVGGLFTSPGKNIAKYNGVWSSLGTGTSNIVNTLATFNDGTGEALYVGGSFTSAGGVVNARRIARWNGTQWSALNTGLGDAPVNALAVHDDGTGEALYVGGQFTHAFSVETRRIARWDGVNWWPLGAGILDDESDPEWCGLPAPQCGPKPASVHTLLASGEQLFVGGDFAWAGGVASMNMARWSCPIPPDLEGDGDVDLADFLMFQSCATAPGIAADLPCRKADLDNDTDVDQDDFAIFQRCFTGSDLPSNPACVP